MDQFWLEFLHYIVLMFAILVTISSSILFYLTQRVEGSTKTYWRTFGFAALAVSYMLFILERKFPSFGLLAVLVEFVGLGCIFIGVRSETSLLQLQNVQNAVVGKKEEASTIDKLKKNLYIIVGVIGGIVLLSGLVLGNNYIIENFSFGPFLAASVVSLSIIFVAGTIYLQVGRYISEREDTQSRRQNLYPLIAYVFILFRQLFLVLYRLPETDLVFLENLKSFYSLPWQAAILLTGVGFIFLAFWAWTFIKVRFFLRTYVAFLTIATLVSTLGSFVFTLLIFSIVEEDNLKVMTEGAKTQYLVMEDRSNTALVLARSIATNDEITSWIDGDDYNSILEETEDKFKTSGIDILRVYDSRGQVVASPSDERERGEVYIDDDVILRVLQNDQPVKTFDVEPHVLSPGIIARGVYPILKDGTLYGAVEVGYRLDTAFVDFSKGRTGLDVTIYSGENISATTILKNDGVSRWVGADETNEDVLLSVLQNGEIHSMAIERLGQNYYSAFIPLRDYSGEIIGMVSVGTLTHELFENSRQQLLSAFLIVTMISLFVALLGYYSLQNFEVDLASSTTESKAKPIGKNLMRLNKILNG